MATGFVPFAKGWKVEEIRQCLGVCKKPMRHRNASFELNPDTVRHLGDGLCDSCHQLSRPRRQKKFTEKEEAVRLEEALKVQAAIRARRNRLGITPDGKVLPRRVMAG